MAKSLDHSIACALLDDLPIPILLMGKDRIEWVNKALARAFDTPEHKLIGLDSTKATATLPAPIFDDSERFGLSDSQGGTVWFGKQKFKLEQAAFEVRIFTDISRDVELENTVERLARELLDLETNHPVTGLFNRKAILQALDIQVSRSRRYENPLALLGLSLKSSRPAGEITDSLKNISRMLKDQLRWADQIGMIDESTFLMILPETSLEAAKELATKLATDRTTLGDHADWTVRFGAAAWRKGDDPGRLLNRLQVDQELNLDTLLS